MKTQLAVIGGGPGGYNAAFRAADLGLSVTIIDCCPRLGGVCLNVGCIPSKMLMKVVAMHDDMAQSYRDGILSDVPTLNLDALRKKKESVVQKLANGLRYLAHKRNIKVIHGFASFKNQHQLQVDDKVIDFDYAIIAVGSKPCTLGEAHPLIMDSTDALALAHIPKSMLIAGGGVNALELGTIYNMLGAKVDVVEKKSQLISFADGDLVRSLQTHLKKQGIHFILNSSVKNYKTDQNKVRVVLEGEVAERQYDAMLVCIGRQASGHPVCPENAGVDCQANGVIPVDVCLRTNVNHIFAIGDVTGGPMLAHYGSAQGKIAAEIISGMDRRFDPLAVPNAIYTGSRDFAWVGLTEKEMKAQNIPYKTACFPWSACGLAVGGQHEDGITKAIFHAETQILVGGAIYGRNASELIGHIIAIMNARMTAREMSLLMYPHPTLSETIPFSAEVFENTVTDLLLKRI